MAYQRWWKTIRDQQGNAINGANCAVYNGGTGTLATVYDPNTDDSAPGSLANPFTTTANGVFGFMAADGEYDVQVSGGNGATQQYRVRLSSAKTSDLEAQWQADDAVVAADAAAATALVRADLASSIGATLIRWLSPLTGAVIRTLAQVFDDLAVSPRWFGAVADGVADDTVAVQKALDSGAGTVRFRKGLYSVLTLTVPSDVSIVGEPGAWLMKQAGSVSDDNNAINIYGTVTATTSAATANVVGGDLAVQVTDGSLFAAGDWCLLRDNTWANTGVAGRNQQVVRVKSVATNTVNLYQAALGPYATADTAELVKITPKKNITIRNLGIVVPTGTNTGGGINLDLAVNVKLEGCEISGPNDNPAMGVSRSYNVDILGNTWRDGQNLTGGGYAYGVAAGEGSSFVRIIGNHQSNIRESIATNRARQVVFSGNTSDYSYDSHFNTHGSWCDGVVISGNTCNGGLVGYAVGYSTHTKADYNVVVSNNIINYTGSHGVSVGAPSGKENQNIIVSTNRIFGCGSTATGFGVNMNGCLRGSIIGNSINGNNNTNATYGIQTINSVDSIVASNSVSDLSNGYGIAINACTNVRVIGNRCDDISSNNYRCIATNAGCSFFGNSADDTNVTIDATTTCDGNSWQTFSGSATYDPPSLADGAGATTTVTATGCALGDLASASFSLDTQGITITAWVSAANTVSVRFQNESGGPLDIASGTLKVQTRKLQGA